MIGTSEFVPHVFQSSVEPLGGAHRILIAPSAIGAMQYLVELMGSYEVGWLGVVDRRGNDFHLEEIIVLRQTVGKAHFKDSNDGLAEYYTVLAQTVEGREKIKKIRLHGHSHPDFSTRASVIDDRQMEVFQKSGSKWFIRGIANRRGELSFDLYLYEAGLVIRDVPWKIYVPEDPALKEKVRMDIELNVTKIVKPPYDSKGLTVKAARAKQKSIRRDGVLSEGVGIFGLSFDSLAPTLDFSGGREGDYDWPASH